MEAVKEEQARIAAVKAAAKEQTEKALIAKNTAVIAAALQKKDQDAETEALLKKESTSADTMDTELTRALDISLTERLMEQIPRMINQQLPDAIGQ